MGLTHGLDIIGLTRWHAPRACILGQPGGNRVNTIKIASHGFGSALRAKADALVILVHGTFAGDPRTAATNGGNPIAALQISCSQNCPLALRSPVVAKSSIGPAKTVSGHEAKPRSNCCDILKSTKKLAGTITWSVTVTADR